MVDSEANVVDSEAHVVDSDAHVVHSEAPEQDSEMDQKFQSSTSEHNLRTVQSLPTIQPSRAHSATPSRRIPGQDIGQCVVCRNMMQMYLQQNPMGKTPFAKLVRDDFAQDVCTAPTTCAFHKTEKRRMDILLHILRGRDAGKRFDALYDEVSRMDKASAKEEKAYMNSLVARYEAKYEGTVQSVRMSLLEESDRIISFWGSQVDDMDAEIEQAISTLEEKHVEEMQRHFMKLAKEAEESRPHYTGTLLQLMETEPKLWGARRFNDAQRLADAGKMLEAAQRTGHELTVEKRTQRKIAQKLCEQARLMDAVVDKMKAHRRQQVVGKQGDRERLQARVRLALTKLQREQRNELRKLTAFVQVQVTKARNLIANVKPDRSKPKHVLYEERKWPTFASGGQSQEYLDVPESTLDFFCDIVFPPPPRALSAGRAATPKAKVPTSRPSSADSGRSPYSNPRTLGKRKPSRGPSVRTQPCDNCGGKINRLCTLPAEEDQTTRLLLQVNPYDTPVLTSTSDFSLYPPQPKGGPPKPPDLGVITRGKAALGYFCCWECARQWNKKNSPTFVQSRRDLVIDLLSTKSFEPITVPMK